MKLTPNLKPKHRVLYMLFGAALVILSVAGYVGGWGRVAAALLGGVSFLEGATGW